MDKCEMLLVDLANSYCNQLWCLVEWVLWASLKQGEKWTAPVIINGNERDLLQAFENRDHTAWIGQELRRLDVLGLGDEMRGILRGAKDHGVNLEDPERV